MAQDNEDDPKDWKRDSLCFRLVDMGLHSADLWYQDDFSPDSKEAAEICFECPVRQACLKQACETKEPFGIWGGLPISLRKQKGRPHNFSRLKPLSNPYITQDEDSPYHPDNLEESDPDGE